MAFGFSDVSVEFDFSDMPRRPDRRSSVLGAAEANGWTGARDKTIGGRVPSALLQAAKDRSGIRSDSELLIYALSKVALEDDFGLTLLSLKGSVPKDVALDV
jgi:hypothetical protein